MLDTTCAVSSPVQHILGALLRATDPADSNHSAAKEWTEGREKWCDSWSDDDDEEKVEKERELNW